MGPVQGRGEALEQGHSSGQGLGRAEELEREFVLAL